MGRYAGIALAAAGALLVGCAINPATGRRNFNLVSEGQEEELGNKAAPEVVKQFGGLYPDRQAQGLVRHVGRKLASASARPELDWTFEVVNSREINAFALPGGHLYVTQGLLARLQNEAQLAGVMGHEVAHVSARHQAQQISKSVALRQALGIGAAVAGEAAPARVSVSAAQVAGRLLVLRFSRDMEAEADGLGIDYAVKAGYDPHGTPEMLTILFDEERLGGSARPPAFLLDHPATEDRLAEASRRIDRYYANTGNAKLVRSTPRFEAVVAQVRAPARPGEPGAAEPLPAGAKTPKE